MCCLLLALCLVLPGCRAGSFAAANLLPVKKIKAVYEPINQTTLIFVDDPRHAVPSIQLLNLIAEKAAHDLTEQKTIHEFVSTGELNTLRAEDAEFKSMPVDEVGKKLGAKQVIYVAVDAFEPGGESSETFRPIAQARVRIVDAKTGKRLFPINGQQGITSMLFFKHAPVNGAVAGRQDAIEHMLAERLGEELGKLFYDHKPREVGSGFRE